MDSTQCCTCSPLQSYPASLRHPQCLTRNTSPALSTAENPSWLWSSRLIPAALALALFLLIGGSLWITNPILEQRQVTTVKGARRELTLADGSRIVLNTDSQILSQIHLRSRQVELVRGEAYFDVVHSRWKPFQVNIGGNKVTVLSTAFDIRRDDQDCAVTALRGRVSVTSTNNPRRTYENSCQSSSATEALRPTYCTVMAVWTKLRLTGLTLGQTVAELRRYQIAPIHVASNVAQIPLSGIVSVDSPTHVLDMLAVAFPLDIRHEKDGSTEVIARQSIIYSSTHTTNAMLKSPTFILNTRSSQRRDS